MNIQLEQVADWRTRLRWQIELAFKRLKKFAALDALRAKEPELAKAWIFANLLAAFLIDDISAAIAGFPPEVPDPEELANSLWPIQKKWSSGAYRWPFVGVSLTFTAIQNAIEERDASS
ncbi:transposase [Escherichia coli]|uniref:transposase n=1 Tax=Escherichia coli TaxID=562 RepID=UPI002228282E|nr:transposase [Escherichia coli]MCW3299654.1 transposase [Escherichia coli]